MPRDRSLDVAVTGLAARFPKSSSLADWWSALVAGHVLTTRYDRRQLLDSGVPQTLADDPAYVPVRGHLDNAYNFDNVLFRMSPREAQLTDPQHRLMLESAWRALEDAGTGPHDVATTTAIFASATGSSYLRNMLAGAAVDPVTVDQVIHGTEPDFMASRIAYKLGLTGPAMAVQTACSSSLVAVHLAVQALLNGDCSQALVIASGIAHPQAGYLYTPHGVLSASGSCRPFDQDADGVVPGSGVVCVVLRRLADAVEACAPPYGVILGSAVNSDGAARAGYYAPSVSGQEAVIRAAMLAADVDAASIGYLEAHGTGTRVGDPIEWAAASAALAAGGARPGQVAVGAVKANIGHLDAAAGLAALVKALMVVREGTIPPVAGFRVQNPLLKTARSPLFVPSRALSWDGPLPRRAAVSAFGIGGTNAHVIVEQPADRHLKPSGPATDVPRLVMLSAADPEALARSAAQLGQTLATGEPELADASFTLAHGRRALPERLAVVGHSGPEAAACLREGRVTRNTCPAGVLAPVVLLFPGQGTQYPGMARALAEGLPGFAASLDACLDAFEPSIAARLRTCLLDRAFSAAELNATELAQPALFTVGYANAQALRYLGIEPAAVLGHSLGEITAACVAGILELPDAARLVVTRGRAMQACPTGAMLALGCGAAQAEAHIAMCGADLEIVAINHADSCVVAGMTDAVSQFQRWLVDRVRTRLLPSDRAFHSRLIRQALPPLGEQVTGLRMHPVRLPFASSLTGRLLTSGTLIDAEMFVRQAAHPVRFADALTAVVETFPNALAVEVAPGATLSAIAQVSGLRSIPLSPRRKTADCAEVLGSVGTLWTMGYPVDVSLLCAGGQRIHLPVYPFAGATWIAREATAVGSAPVEAHIARSSPQSVPGSARTPRTLLEELWMELLGHAHLSEDADFFELGGDSMLITNLAQRVEKELGVRVPLRDMLAGRTLGRQATIVTNLLASVDVPK